MKRYEPPKPGVAFAFAAAAMAVMTMVAFVILPAELESLGHFARPAASAPAETLAVPVPSIAGPGEAARSVDGHAGAVPSSDGDGRNERQS